MSFVYQFGKRTYDLASRTHVMGILNVTPDSFSDGGKFFDTERAVDRALQMIEEGADIIDIGGESTRPKSRAYGEGAEPVDAAEELHRVVPVIRKLSRQTDIPISIDTYKSAVATEALNAGATIVNDISGFLFDSAMPEAVARAGASAILMHIKGTPKTMQQNPAYSDVVGEVREYLSAGLERAAANGIRQLAVDPGIGFGKTRAHNLSLIRRLGELKSLRYPILIGVSRKAFIGELLDQPTERRMEGSLSAAVVAVVNGANIIRTHDVRETVHAVRLADAIISSN